MNTDFRVQSPPQPQETQRQKVDPQIREAAEGIEALFLDYMLKTMRESVQKSEFSLDNSATEIYRAMLDSEVAQKTAKTHGIGLAEQMIAYMEAQRYNQGQGKVPNKPFPATSTGGTDASTITRK